MTGPGPPPLVLATGNPDKATEIRDVLAEHLAVELAATPVEVAGVTVGVVVAPPADLPAVMRSLPVLRDRPDVEETGATLEENARIKATAVAEALRITAVADDTGLEVDALDGAPGVHAARYAGPDATYRDNVAKLLAEMAGVAGDRRAARFATVALARRPDGSELVARGEVEGLIAVAPRGEAGFGYDPVFVPSEGDGRTFAEMTAAEKHRISHRGRAFRALARRLRGP